MIRSLYIGLLKKSIYVNQKLLVLPPNSLHKLCYCSGDIKNSTYDDPQRRKKKLELEVINRILIPYPKLGMNEREI